MPQYGMIVYSPAPADPMAMSAERLAGLEAYPDQVVKLKGKILGASYFAKQRGFAFGPSTEAMCVTGAAGEERPLATSGLVASAFYVVAAPNLEVALQVAKLHPAAAEGAVEVHPIFKPAGLVQNDYDD